jgi:pyruvyltransferase
MIHRRKTRKANRNTYKTKHEPITVYYYISKNFGDGINPLIFNHLMKKKPIYKHIHTTPIKSSTPYIVGIGSILSMRNVQSSHQIICGSGFIKKERVPQKPLRILSVRGPMTRQKFLDGGIDCPEIYGDMALLLRFIIKPPIHRNIRFKYGIIPHYVDKNTDFVKMARKNPDCRVIDIEQADTPEKFVKEINECDIILSSTLHGIIICDSYAIPAYHIVLTDKLMGGDWKFKDYYGSVRRTYSTVDINQPLESLNLEPYEVHFDFDGYYKYMKKELNSL